MLSTTTTTTIITTTTITTTTNTTHQISTTTINNQLLANTIPHILRNRQEKNIAIGIIFTNFSNYLL
ncbi:hypothetical protein E2C01_022401 [Portunus trituberculatus]|uniref:Uncharacterized protein n=1 Tax=Portunus trituberculatus TaxID=210409 RepID=A0A5B7E595_PORTR|nr:hypothetical protein [Portunus trituberculatus]